MCSMLHYLTHPQSNAVVHCPLYTGVLRGLPLRQLVLSSRTVVSCQWIKRDVLYNFRACVPHACAYIL
ncbi:hypothetical protein [Capybara microvirus Cap1_SP_50]|nr:hypothetical protein [Apis mellifera associated microvirus 55]QCS35928.1 hypothetical protein [Capybara microvirus Cap1_SP_50]